ncbi:MAG TPA: hypothetical protein VHT21_17700, partial [Stellaceae bacterium]|nr:hypothetical protein [Stellaceae bacterium]
ERRRVVLRAGYLFGPVDRGLNSFDLIVTLRSLYLLAVARIEISAADCQKSRSAQHPDRCRAVFGAAAPLTIA